MTTVESVRFRPDSRVARDLAWRAVVVLIAAAGVLLEVPVWARVPLSIAAAVVTLLFFLGRSRTRGALDGTLTAIGILVVGLMAVGVLLNALPAAIAPGGITTAGWGIGVGVLELVALVLLAFWRAPHPLTTRMPRVPASAVAWTLAIVVALGGALAWSISSFSSTHVAPLTMAAVPAGTTEADNSVIITVSSGQELGPYNLQVVTDGQRATIARDIRIGPRNPGSITVTVPANTREKLQLVRPGSTTPVRELILDTITTPAKVSR